MTYREKHRERFPTVNADLVHIFQCPRNPNTGDVVACTESGCRACWDREMEEVTEMEKKPCPVDRGKLLIGLEHCQEDVDHCDICPYSRDEDCCSLNLRDDARAYIYHLEEQLNAKANGSD